MSNLLRAAVLVCWSLFSGCVAAGQPCTGSEAACTGGNASVWCEGGAFAAIACPGELGCTTGNQKVVCDFTGSSEGSACPAAAKEQGIGFCASSTRFVTCDGAKWVGRDCSSCMRTGLASVCQP